MTHEKTADSYYILESIDPEQMLLYSIHHEDDEESWTIGQRFRTPPQVPVVATIQEGYENKKLLPYFGTPPVMSCEFHEALLEAGVENLDVYDAVLRSEDGKIEYRGFKAFCVVGLVAAADLKRTIFSAGNPSRRIDAGIDHLVLDESKTGGILCFRLAEYTGSVFIHEKVKRCLEKKNFPSVVFREVTDFISL